MIPTKEKTRDNRNVPVNVGARAGIKTKTCAGQAERAGAQKSKQKQVPVKISVFWTKFNYY